MKETRARTAEPGQGGEVGGQLLEDRTAIVTGAGRGLGKAFAEALAANGARIIVADIGGDDAERSAEEIAQAGGKAVPVVFDQTDPSQVAALVETTRDTFGPPHILVNNAALFSSLTRKAAAEITPEEWSDVLRANLTGPFLCSRAVLPDMVELGYGKIVNIVSASIFQARNRLAHYVAAKAGLVGLTRALAREYGSAGVRVNALSPGATDTGASISTPEYLEQAARTRALPRVQVPEDLTGALVFLCASTSDFMTGQHIVVDGGAVFQ